MSIALLIENVNGKEDYFPISTQESFKKNWRPICEKEGFEWIPLFETGSTFNEKDLPYILLELKKFNKICIENSSYSDETIISRLKVVLSKLEKLGQNKVRFFIG